VRNVRDQLVLRLFRFPFLVERALQFEHEQVQIFREQANFIVLSDGNGIIEIAFRDMFNRLA
jgi:hypothetical protein